MNEINWTPKATKQVAKLDRPMRITIIDAVDELASMPNCQNVKALKNHEYGFRLRVW